MKISDIKTQKDLMNYCVFHDCTNSCDLVEHDLCTRLLPDITAEQIISAMRSEKLEKLLS